MNMKETKILVNYIGRTGGGAIFSYEMTKGLIENGAIVTAIIPEGISNLDNWKKLSFHKLFIIETYCDKKTFITGTLKFVFYKQWKLRNEIKHDVFDFCYIPMIQPWTFLINRLVKGIKIVATLHDPIPHSGSHKIIEYFTVNKWVAAKADKLIILTAKFLNEVCSIYKKTPEQVKVVPHGIFDYSQYDNGQIIKRDYKYNFLFFGRIEKYKGIQILLQAYYKLKNENDDISLFIVGKGNMEEYKSLISVCQDITVVNRFVDDDEVVSYFRGNNIITVLPYIDATQSGVVPIAMKEESLIIATNTGGLAEQTGNGKYALLCEPSIDSVYQTMKYAITHYSECKNIIHAAKKYADSLSWRALAKKVIEFGGSEN